MHRTFLSIILQFFFQFVFIATDKLHIFFGDWFVVALLHVKWFTLCRKLDPKMLQDIICCNYAIFSTVPVHQIK